ncbi:hypothetical protein ACRALDRAFT_2025165 [Sodiomyces alcalophilus JCM 7366]|uniref:uncharacterized protein n=1 Tax=Sodiomyces alcalophilus JCM 7366 TaxID=591952 RepID=UPI0039B4A2E3
MNMHMVRPAPATKQPHQSLHPASQGLAPAQAPQGTPQMQLGIPQMPQGAAAPPWAKISPAIVANMDWTLYDYHPADDGGFWKLQPGYAASDQLPDIIPLAVTSRSPIQQPKDVEWTCLSPGCPSKPFKRKVDLDRHYKEAHADGMPITPVSSVSFATPSFDPQVAMLNMGAAPPGPGGSSAGPGPGPGVMAPAPTAPGMGTPIAPATGSVPASLSASAGPTAVATSSPTAAMGGGPGALGKDGKEKEGVFYCDYSACPRRTDGFNRKDRFRLHLQETHKEDVNKKGGRMEDSWLDSRKMSNKWWRCTKCLERVKIEEHGWECPRDQVKCEKRRREYREKM